jgi:hypothetical protein
MLTGISALMPAEYVMPFTVPAHQRQFPLHIHISVVFTLLLLLMGVALGVFNYLQNTRIILDSSQKLFDQIEQDVQLDLLNTYQPLRSTLNLLAQPGGADRSI